MSTRTFCDRCGNPGLRTPRVYSNPTGAPHHFPYRLAVTVADAERPMDLCQACIVDIVTAGQHRQLRYYAETLEAELATEQRRTRALRGVIRRLKANR